MWLTAVRELTSQREMSEKQREFREAWGRAEVHFTFLKQNRKGSVQCGFPIKAPSFAASVTAIRGGADWVAKSWESNRKHTRGGFACSLTSCKELPAKWKSERSGYWDQGKPVSWAERGRAWQTRKEINGTNSYPGFIDKPIYRISKIRERREGGAINERISSENSSVLAKLGLTPRPRVSPSLVPFPL